MNLLIEGYGWTLDIAFFVILLLGLFFGAWRGFVRGIMKVAGWLFSLVVAFFFCMPLRTFLQDTFGLVTMLSNAMGGRNTLADILSVVICFVALLILVKFFTWLLGRGGTALVNQNKVARGINKFLGALLGLVKAVIAFFILLMLAKWIENWLALETIGNFIRSSFVVSKIYDWEWFVTMTTMPGKLIAGQAALMLP